MLTKHLLTAVGSLLLSSALYAQKINTDSLTSVTKISEYQLKRAKLQNQVEEKTKDKTNAAEKSQASANQNSEDANRLSNDSQNKKLAKNADNAASTAKKDSKKARKAGDDLDNLNKSIADLTEKIAKEQHKLNQYLNPAVAVVVPVTPPVPVDTTHQQ